MELKLISNFKSYNSFYNGEYLVFCVLCTEDKFHSLNISEKIEIDSIECEIISKEKSHEVFTRKNRMGKNWDGFIPVGLTVKIIK